MPLLTIAISPPHSLVAQAGSAGFLPDMLMAGGVLIITLGVFSMLRKRLKKSDRRPQVGRPTIDRRRAAAHDEHAARQSIESLVVEAEELVRRLAAHLDAKSARLETLIRQADERIARMDGRAAGAESPPPSRPHIESKMVDPVSRDVYRLADEGLAPIEIAQRLSEGVGKVELILALREN